MNSDNKSIQALFLHNKISTDTLVDVSSCLEAVHQMAGLVPLIGYQIQATITLGQSIIRIIRVRIQRLIFNVLTVPLKDLKGGHRMAQDLCEKVHKLLDLLRSPHDGSLGKEAKTVFAALQDAQRYVHFLLLTYVAYKIFFQSTHENRTLPH